jgi:hypothetical protein
MSTSPGPRRSSPGWGGQSPRGHLRQQDDCVASLGPAAWTDHGDLPAGPDGVGVPDAAVAGLAADRVESKPRNVGGAPRPGAPPTTGGHEVQLDVSLAWYSFPSPAGLCPVLIAVVPTCRPTGVKGGSPAAGRGDAPGASAAGHGSTRRAG